MKKFGLKCPIRQANPYRRMMKATQEHTTCENIVNRVFKTGIPYNVLLTDITYLFTAGLHTAAPPAGGIFLLCVGPADR